MTDHMHDSSQSIAVVNGEQSCKADKFHRAFVSNHYDLLLGDLDIASSYTVASSHVDPPKSGEDLHAICESLCDLGLPT